LTNSAVAVTNGVFTVPLDFGPNVFTGQALWLESAVRANGAGGFSLLPPREPLTGAPYALYAAQAASASNEANAAISATNLNTPLAAAPDQVLTYNGSSLAWMTLSGNNTPSWLLSGNAGTAPGTHFLGTTDNQPLELKVNAQRALRIEPGVNGLPNLVGGAAVNAVDGGVFGAVIGGGGEPAWPNQVGSDYGTISGGKGNLIAGGGQNSTVSGGTVNTIEQNTLDSVIGGGHGNVIQSSSFYGFIGGGQNNTNGHLSVGAVVPGGRDNFASGMVSFAAGTRAKALTDGSFVWADYTESDFASTGNNQFLIRASAGVGIGTNNPRGALHVAGSVTASGFNGSGAGLTGVAQLNANQTFTGTASFNPADGPPFTVCNNTMVTNLNADLLDGLDSTHSWKLGGNAGTTPGANFLGTRDSQPLEFKVNNLRVLRIEPVANNPSFSNLFNVVGGSPVNYITPGTRGAVLVGGGAASWQGLGTTNGVSADLAFLGGGGGNSIRTESRCAFLGGGLDNSGETNSSGSFLGGGVGNSIQGETYGSFLGGGDNNSIQTSADRSFLGGGEYNTTEGSLSFLGGGAGNSIQLSSTNSFLGGGYQNKISSWAELATIAGGAFNHVSGAGAFIGGGGYDGENAVGNTASGVASVICGGTANIASGPRSTVAGGHDNSATNWSSVPGGAWNSAGGQGSFAAGRSARALNDGCFVWNCDWQNALASTATDQFLARANGGFAFYTSTSGGATLAAGSGSWTSMSDRNAKENFAPVDPQAVLEKVAELPLSSWNYKAQDPAIRHLGPVAQDFKAAFSLGETDTGITGVDADGVALAAIQGLNQKLKERDAKIQALKQRLEALEKLVGQLSSK
jgi:hypothetical protein